MKLNGLVGKSGIALVLMAGSAASHAAAQKVCVFDILGPTGDPFNMAQGLFFEAKGSRP